MIEVDHRHCSFVLTKHFWLNFSSLMLKHWITLLSTRILPLNLHQPSSEAEILLSSKLKILAL